LEFDTVKLIKGGGALCYTSRSDESWRKIERHSRAIGDWPIEPRAVTTQ